MREYPHRCRVVALAGFLLAAAVGSRLLAAPYVISPSGQKIQGTSVKVMNDGQVALTTADGQVTFPKGTKAFVDEPSDYGKALRMMEQRQYDEAIKLLKGIINDYRYLGWDRKARNLLASVYVSKEDFKSALATYEELFADSPEMEKEGDAQLGYMRSLLATGNRAKLAPLLAQAIASGPRNAAALAQILRGDDRLAAGDIEDALFDYLRTAELFKDVPTVQAEANFKAAECLEKMGDARSLEYYNAVVKEYPKSTFAEKARLRLK